MFLSRLSKSLQKEQSFIIYFNYSTKLYKDNNIMSDNNDNIDNNDNAKSETLKSKNFEKLCVEKDEDKPEWYEAHKMAIQNNQHFYTDPVTGYKVMTELYHISRGYCCGSKCRHCPFNHENVGKKINLKDLINDDVNSVDDDNNVVENKKNEDN